MNSRRQRVAGGVAALILALAAFTPAASATTEPAPPPPTTAAVDPAPTPTVPAPVDPSPSDPTPSDPTPPADPSPTPSDPTDTPTDPATGEPTADPTDPASDPTAEPSTEPTAEPTDTPTDAPTGPEGPAEPPAPTPPQIDPNRGTPYPQRITSTWAFPNVSLLPSGPLLSANWSNPVFGRLTSLSGMRTHPVTGVSSLHAGVDIAASCGTPVHAASDGVVVFVGNGFQGRTGNQVVIAHGDGMITRYGHLLSGTTTVEIGDEVSSGQVIAQVGGSRSIDPVGAGTSTGCHLHFEVNAANGSTIVNPVDYLKAAGVAIATDQPRVAEEDSIETLTVFDVLPGPIPSYSSVVIEIPVDGGLEAVELTAG